MKSFKVVYAPLASMEEDDDDALDQTEPVSSCPTFLRRPPSVNISPKQQHVPQHPYTSLKEDGQTPSYDQRDSGFAAEKRTPSGDEKTGEDGLDANLGRSQDQHLGTSSTTKKSALETPAAQASLAESAMGPGEQFLRSLEFCHTADADVSRERCLDQENAQTNSHENCKVYDNSHNQFLHYLPERGDINLERNTPGEHRDVSESACSAWSGTVCLGPQKSQDHYVSSDSLPNYSTAVQQLEREDHRNEIEISQDIRPQPSGPQEGPTTRFQEDRGQSLAARNVVHSESNDVDYFANDDMKVRMELCPSRRRGKSSFPSRARLVAFLLKYILFLLNFFFWITSVAAIVIGAWVLSERGQIVRESAAFFLDPNAMLCLLGSLIFLVAFCGCLGALRENIFLLKVIGMVVVLVLEALCVLMVFAFYQMPEFRKALKGGPEKVLAIAIRRYYDDDELKRWIDLIQKEFKCCGARHSEEGYRDWQQNPYFNCTPSNPSVQRCGVPRSCCIIERGEYINHMCGFDTTNKQRSEVYGRIHTQGCMKGLGLWLSAHDVTIGSVSLAIIVPQIVCVVLAHLLKQRIQQQRLRYENISHHDG